MLRHINLGVPAIHNYITVGSIYRFGDEFLNSVSHWFLILPLVIPILSPWEAHISIHLLNTVNYMSWGTTSLHYGISPLHFFSAFRTTGYIITIISFKRLNICLILLTYFTVFYTFWHNFKIYCAYDWWWVIYISNQEPLPPTVLSFPSRRYNRTTVNYTKQEHCLTYHWCNVCSAPSALLPLALPL